MQKRHIVIILLIAACISLTSGCANKQLTKIEGSSAEQNVSSVKQQNAGANAAMQQSNQASGNSNAGYKSTGSKNAVTSSMNQRVSSHLQDVHFAFDSSAIEPQYRNILRKDADYLISNSRVKVTIEGHCDERGTSEYNMALGQHRADEVKKYLVNLGVAGKSMTTVSYGKERPLDPGHDENAWAKNRRAHFEVN
jgi:peptidoglycan-associated lipoprotein